MVLRRWVSFVPAGLGFLDLFFTPELKLWAISVDFFVTGKRFQAQEDWKSVITAEEAKVAEKN